MNHTKCHVVETPQGKLFAFADGDNFLITDGNHSGNPRPMNFWVTVMAVNVEAPGNHVRLTIDPRFYHDSSGRAVTYTDDAEVIGGVMIDTGGNIDWILSLIGESGTERRRNVVYAALVHAGLVKPDA